MARNYNNLAHQQSEVLDSLHRRVNTDGPLLIPPQSRNIGGVVHGSVGPNQKQIESSEAFISHGNILLDDGQNQHDDFDEEEPHTNDMERQLLIQQMGVNKPGRAAPPGENIIEDSDENGIDAIDVEQLRQMMSDPRYAALFSSQYGNVQFQQPRGSGQETGSHRRQQPQLYEYEDEDGEHHLIDMNNLPAGIDPREYYEMLMQHHGGEGDEDIDDEEDEEDQDGHNNKGIVGRGNGQGFFAEGDSDEGTSVQFNENAKSLQQKFEYDEEGRMLPEAESDYCEDLAEIYIQNGTNEDVDRYKAIHLMDKGANYNNNDDEHGEKFQCEETGAHFEFLEMCRRLKRLQTLRVGIDKTIEEQIQRNLAFAQKLLQQQQQQQQLSPLQHPTTNNRAPPSQTQQNPNKQTLHLRNDSAKRPQGFPIPQQQINKESHVTLNEMINASGSARRSQTISAAIDQQQQQFLENRVRYTEKHISTNSDVMQNQNDKGSGSFSVYGAQGGSSTTTGMLQQKQQQRMQSTGKPQPQATQAVQKVISANAGGGYVNTQNTQQTMSTAQKNQSFSRHNNGALDTELTPKNLNLKTHHDLQNPHTNQDHEDQILRQHQQLLLATENDEDEIVDLLGSAAKSQASVKIVSSKIPLHDKSGKQSKAVIGSGAIKNQSMGGNVAAPSHHQYINTDQMMQAQQKRKPPITGSTQKATSKKSITSGHQLFQTNTNQNHTQQQQCYTEVRDSEERPNRAQQVAYNNFFKLGPQEQQQKLQTIQGGGHKRNNQLDIKTQKDLELLALSQQFIEQQTKLLSGAQNNTGSLHNRNNQHHQHQQFATHTYFPSNSNNHHQQQPSLHQPQLQSSYQQRASKRQASASGGLGGHSGAFLSGSKQYNSNNNKKTRTGSTSQAQAFNTANSRQSNNKFVSHQTVGSTATANLVTSNNGGQPIVMVMNPSKQTQIQNILMNIYQSTNSRASQHYHQYDHRVYPTRVSNKNSNATSIIGTKGQLAKQQHILLSTDATPGSIPHTKIMSTSSHHQNSQHQQQQLQALKSGVNNPQSSNNHLLYASAAGQINHSILAGGDTRKSTIQKINNSKQLSNIMMMKKPVHPQNGQRNLGNNLTTQNTIDSNQKQQNRESLLGMVMMQMGQPPQHIMAGMKTNAQNTGASTHGSRPQSAIKKKSTGISPNSKAAKHLHILNSGTNAAGRQTSTKPSSKAYVAAAPHHHHQYSKYDALNPKYIQFKSRDSQHKKTNSYSIAGLSGGSGAANAFSSYTSSKGAGQRNKNSMSGVPVETYTLNQGQQHNNHQVPMHQQQPHQMYQTVDSQNQYHQQHQPMMTMNGAGTFIEHPEVSNMFQIGVGGTPSSNAQGTKRSLILHQQQPLQHRNHIYDASPPTQKQKGSSIASGVGNLKLSSVSGKSRQPNHIISSGGILSDKLASNTVQDTSLKMDMNAIIKKLATRKPADQQAVNNHHYQQPHVVLTGGNGVPPMSFGTFDSQQTNSRYGTNAVTGSSHHQHAMSFAGKKITAVTSGGQSHSIHHQSDATKRLSVNLHQSGFMNKIGGGAPSSSSGVSSLISGFNQVAQSNKVRGTHSKGKGTTITAPHNNAIGGASSQTRHSSVIPNSNSSGNHQNAHQQHQLQTKSTKRINSQVATGGPLTNQANGAVFASSKKSNRASQGMGISYDYRNSDRRCDTVS